MNGPLGRDLLPNRVPIRALVGVWLVVFSLGCGHELSMRAPDFRVQNARVVFMPAMVSLYLIEEDGELTFDDASSKQARIRVNTWLRFLSASGGFRLADLREITPTELTSDAFYNEMDAVTKRIVADDGRHSLAAWSTAWSLHDGALQSWAPALKADYLCFVAFRGAYETEARRERGGSAILAGALIGGAVGGLVGAALFRSGGGDSTVRRGALVVVDLRRNQIVRVQTVGFEQLDNAEIQQDLGKLVAALGG
jgi:hypothetical protein